MHSENAGLARRLGAIFYDSLLVVIGLMPMVTLPFIAVRGGEPVGVGETFYQFVLIATTYLFFSLFWSRYGRTLGMQAWRLRIETPEGHRPDFVVASMRFFAAIVSFLPAGLGFWWQLVDKEGLSWHDRISGTRLRHYPKPSTQETSNE